MKLHTKILMGLVGGIAVGAAAKAPGMDAVQRGVIAMEPVGTVFIRLITMVVVPLVVASLFVGVASLGDVRRLGRIGGKTLAYFAATTLVAAAIGLGVALITHLGANLDPSVRDVLANQFHERGSAAAQDAAQVPSFVKTLIAMVPQNPFAAAASGDLLPLIVAVCAFGAAATVISGDGRRAVVSFFQGVNDLSMVIVGWLMQAAPVAVLVLVAAMVAKTGFDLLKSLLAFALVVVLGLAVHVAVVLVPLIRVGARMGVAFFFRSVSDALLLAFSTASSSATLPVSMAAAQSRLGISNEIVSFVLPSGSTLNKNGAAVYKAVTAVFIAQLYGVALTPGVLVTIVLVSAMAAFAGPGVPGSSLVTTLIVLNAIGLGPHAAEGIALVVGVDRPLDMCRSAVNTIGNLVVASVIARSEGEALTGAFKSVTAQTISEKILSAKAGRAVSAGDVVMCNVDRVIGTDASSPMAIDYFQRMGGEKLFDPSRVMFAFDHYSPATTDKTKSFHEQVRRFARMFGAELHDEGEGISFQLAAELGRVLPGDLVIGADSHTVTCGALNLFATGVGSSDLAAAMITGQVWLRVPETINVTLTGALAPGVRAKDIALALVAEIGVDGANYQTLEFRGPALPGLTLDDRLVICNLAVEMDAKASIFPFDAATDAYLAPRTRERGSPVVADADARYVREVSLDLSALSPQLARPHSPGNVGVIADGAGVPVHMVFIGTCTGGRVADFHDALDVLERAGGRVAEGVQLVLTPASRDVNEQLRGDGTLARFESMGAIVTAPGCGACCGTSGVIPGDGATVLSTANRNFKARMGNATASIYLASPAACAASAAVGRITDPRTVPGER